MRRPLSQPLLSLTIAAAVACSPMLLPNTALAGAPAEGEGEPEAEDPAFTEAKALYSEGKVKFDTADYEDALVLWKKAFAILPDGDEYRTIRHSLVYNIAEAHSRAYEVSRNPTHLRKAKILLENYRADHRALYGDEPEAVTERAEVDDRIAEIDNKIAASEAAGETATPLSDDGGGGATTTTTTDTQPQPAPPPKPLTPQQQWEAEVKADPVLGPKWSTGTKRVVGGAVMVGIGGIFAIISLSAFLAAPAADPFSGALYATGGVTGAIALGLVTPGGVLIGTGVGRRKQVLEAKPKPTASLAPILGPNNYGVGFVGRF